MNCATERRNTIERHAAGAGTHKSAMCKSAMSKSAMCKSAMSKSAMSALPRTDIAGRVESRFHFSVQLLGVLGPLLVQVNVMPLENLMLC